MSAAERIAVVDSGIINFLKKISGPLARFALFVVFFWFGILKVLGTSPASAMVEALQQRTLPFLSFSTFMACFGIYEMIIGLLFIIPRFERIAIALLVPHFAATMLPLIFLPKLAWQSFLVPTMEGQYIIKNLALIALAIDIGAYLQPVKTRPM